jgi:hypothetical protein
LTLVRRRSPVVEAVQWHKPGDHPAARPVTYPGGGHIPTAWGWVVVMPGEWIVPDDNEHLSRLDMYRVLTPEQFAEEYERVED